MPFVNCAGSATKPISIKFAPVGNVKALEEKNIGEYLFDDGSKAAQKGIFL